MPTKLNIPTNFASFVEQPGTVINLDRTGSATVIATLGGDAADLDAVLAALPGSIHPRFSWAGFESARVLDDEGEVALVTVTYAGRVPGPGFDYDPDLEETLEEPDRYRLGFVTVEEPLLTAPRYRDLVADERDALLAILNAGDANVADDQGTPLRDNVTSALGLEALDKIARGQTSWKAPRLAWTVGYTREQVPRDAFRRRGKIAIPPGPAPTFTDGTNWLLEGAEIAQRGATHDIELVFLASDPGTSWDPDLYS